ncbi:vesicle transport SFT2A [Brachionus plicatilis]|uniref:Vesicle transport protein n=1 Tax=Brachionus plicatilis TaxID=10195 RepID=A0A3M7RXP5_BRAPC|nr:vesicle transport SFT2A [Brachionus plicatilis]
METFKNVFGTGSAEQEQDEETGIMDELWKNSSLSWSTRIKGFVFLFVFGYLISFISTSLLLTIGLVPFAVLYTIGNMCSMLSTLFLMGPVSQLKKMFASTRIIATIIVLISIVCTLLCAFLLKNPLLCILCVLIQFFAMLWYSISYIPFARDAVKKFFGAVLDI